MRRNKDPGKYLPRDNKLEAYLGLVPELEKEGQKNLKDMPPDADLKSPYSKMRGFYLPWLRVYYIT